jgi:hypothetical protein
MENHCAVKCPVVTEAVKDATPTSKLNMAIAAVVFEKISLREAGRRFGVDHSSISKRIKKNGTVVNGHHVQPKTQPQKNKPTAPDDAERDQWWADYQGGMSYTKIAAKYGRHRTTVTKEIKRREEAEAQPEPAPTPEPTPTPSAPQPTPTPTPEPTPPTSVPSAGSSEPNQWANDEDLDGWNGTLGEKGGVAERIYNREVKSSRFRMEIANRLAEIKAVLEKTMNAAQKNHTEERGKLLEVRVKMVEATLQREERPGINDSLLAVMHEAERIYKFASETRRLLQLEKADT